jgi:hypothetical protein
MRILRFLWRIFLLVIRLLPAGRRARFFIRAKFRNGLRREARFKFCT